MTISDGDVQRSRPSHSLGTNDRLIMGHQVVPRTMGTVEADSGVRT